MMNAESALNTPKRKPKSKKLNTYSEQSSYNL